jgi:hypothetical protein
MVLVAFLWPRLAPLVRSNSAAQGQEFADVVAHAAQHVLRLQDTTAGEARSHMQRMEPCHPDQKTGVGGGVCCGGFA